MLEPLICLVQNLLGLSMAVCLGVVAIPKKTLEAPSTQLHFFCTSVNLYQQPMTESLGGWTRLYGFSFLEAVLTN